VLSGTAPTGLAQRLGHNPLDFRGDIQSNVPERRGLLFTDRDQRVSCARAGEGRASGQHFVDETPEAPDVGPRVDGHAARLFRRHILSGAEHHACLRVRLECRGCARVVSLRVRQRQFRNAEIEHFDLPVPPHHDVLRLDVAMNDAGVVSGGEG
jgi:hypothetical protein